MSGSSTRSFGLARSARVPYGLEVSRAIRRKVIWGCYVRGIYKDASRAFRIRAAGFGVTENAWRSPP